jgi:alanyl-tRNA synthetase
MKAQEIRKQFIEFFESKQHNMVDSAPLIIKDDPTLLFTNSGMNQFKDLFLGNAPVKFPRVCNSQKCLRVSGKHNDLEEVGVDTYHHTLFEMLGNWSFGDYFKADAINWAWEFLVDVCKINPNNLYVTVFEGAKDDGLGMDQEAYDLWKKIIPEDRILMGNKKDNFWEMGKMGPCGPCTEIHVDIRDESEKLKISGKDLVNNDHPQVIEVWNLVFMEFNRLANGSLQKLPAQHVDTGMGFERLAMVLQGKQSNYDTDVFANLISKVEELTKIKYGTSTITDIAIRVIVDHVRAVSFAVADGQMPSNTGAGYVIRRILRRAVRYAFSKLNYNQPLLCQLVNVLATEMGGYFPEIKLQQALVEKVIQEEENNFLRTLDKGIDRYQAHKSDLKSNVLSGKIAFELYDTFGFPIDLTQLLAREDGLTVDMEEFESELQIQKDRSRKASLLETDDWQVVNEGDGKFVGYDFTQSETEILRYRAVKNKGKNLFQIELKESPFYPEGGGQVGDQGWLVSGDKKIKVVDTKKENGVILLSTEHIPSEPQVKIKALVDETTRFNSACNHSATHLLHYALRSVLGSHVEQKGSLVNKNYLRFDFSHFQKVTDEELQQIVTLVKEQIRQNLKLNEEREISIQEAKNKGAMALFGEKYGDKVRMIQFGKSVELCGGIHVSSTAQIGNFIITSESAVAAGIRRIEAITGDAADAFLQNELNTLKEIKSLLKNPKDILQQIQILQDEKSLIEKQFLELINEKATLIKNNLSGKIEKRNGVEVLIEKIEINSADAVKDICFQFKQKYPNLLMILGAEINQKPNLSVIIGDELLQKGTFKANEIIKDLSRFIQGGGGGQPFYATAGGKKLEGLNEALQAAQKIV